MERWWEIIFLPFVMTTCPLSIEVRHLLLKGFWLYIYQSSINVCLGRWIPMRNRKPQNSFSTLTYKVYRFQQFSVSNLRTNRIPISKVRNYSFQFRFLSSASLPVCLSVCLCLSLCISLCIFLCICVCICISLSLSVCLSLSVSVSVCLSPYIYVHWQNDIVIANTWKVYRYRNIKTL